MNKPQFKPGDTIWWAQIDHDTPPRIHGGIILSVAVDASDISYFTLHNRAFQGFCFATFEEANKSLELVNHLG